MCPGAASQTRHMLCYSAVETSVWALRDVRLPVRRGLGHNSSFLVA